MGPADTSSRDFAKLPPRDGGVTRPESSTHVFDLVVIVLDALLNDGVVARCHFLEVLVDRFAVVRDRVGQAGRSGASGESAHQGFMACQHTGVYQESLCLL